MAGFTADEVDRFMDQGWLVRRGLYSHADLQPLRDSITAQLDAECDALIGRGEMTEAQAMRDEPFDTRLGKVVHGLKDYSVAQMTVLKSMQDLFLAGRFAHAAIAPNATPVADTLLACIRNQAVLDHVESLVGPEIVGSSTFRIRGKIPKWGPGATLRYFPEAVPWHQDAGYMLAHCDPHLIVTCWIPLVDATVGNGCMHVYPYRFADGVLPHRYLKPSLYLEIPPTELPPGRPLAMEVNAGDVLFLNNMTPHASFDNASAVTRWSMDIRYTARATPNNVDEAPESYTPDREPTTMACAPTEADFVVRDPDNPEHEVRDGARFAAVRYRYARQHVNPGRGWTFADGTRGPRG